MTLDEYQTAVVTALTSIQTQLSKLEDINNKLGTLLLRITATNRALDDIHNVNSTLVDNTTPRVRKSRT